MLQWGVIVFIVGAHILALIAAPFTFSLKALLLCLVLHWVTGGLGITLGFHRLLTHQSFKVWKPVQNFLALLGTLACQGGPITWVAAHRAHHAYSDTEKDPHTPLKSFFWAHMGWCLVRNPNIDTWEARERFAPDLIRDRFLLLLEKTHIVWTFFLGAGLFLWGGWSFVVWGVFVRLVLVYHSTWFVNSAAHTWGYRTYDAKDRSTNLWWVALLTYGEGWHNNHHAFQQSARHGLKWWEIDTTYWMVKILQWLRLAQSVKIPTPYQLAEKKTAA